VLSVCLQSIGECVSLESLALAKVEGIFVKKQKKQKKSKEKRKESSGAKYHLL
jgi:hypothetical protein